MGLGIVGIGLQLVGANKASKSLKRQGAAARERGYEQKSFNEVAAGQMIAVGQRAAMEESRQAELMASRAVAVAAAGGYVDDITHLIADIHGEGVYRASVMMHDARQSAEQLIFEGEQAAKYGEDVYAAKKREARGTKIAALGSIFDSGLF